MKIIPPNLHLLSSNPWDFQPEELTVDLLKFRAWLLWPLEKQETQRNQILARSVLELSDSLEDSKETVSKSNKYPDRFKKYRIDRTDNSLQALRRQLLQPAGGSRIALQVSDRELTNMLASRSRHARTAASIVEFILRYHIHNRELRRGPSITKATAFIENGGFSDRNLLKNRADIITAWSELKSVAHFCYADAMLKGIFCNPDIQSASFFEKINEFWWDEVLHAYFFGFALYSQNVLTSLVPSGAKEALLRAQSILSLSGIESIPDVVPFLPTFNNAEMEIISNFKTREQWTEKSAKPVSMP